jgi:hypothetical protein
MITFQGSLGSIVVGVGYAFPSPCGTCGSGRPAFDDRAPRRERLVGNLCSSGSAQRGFGRAVSLRASQVTHSDIGHELVDLSTVKAGPVYGFNERMRSRVMSGRSAFAAL